MAETITKTATLTHKVRNPQDLGSWLDIWTATVSANFSENNARTNETIVITPSNNWQITADKLGTIPVTKIVDTNDTYNVTTSSPIGSNALIKTDGDGNLVAGPTAPASNGNATYFLNQKGQWAQVDTSFTVDLKTITEGDQTTISNAEFKVGNNSVIVKPQGKLAFSNVSEDNKEIQLSLGKIQTEDLDLNNFNLPFGNITNVPINSAEVAGMVKKGNDKESPSVWLTTASTSGNYTPDWGQIQTGHIEDDAVTEGKIADGSVTEDKIANGSVTTDKIVDSAITEVKIADGSITTDKIADGAVTEDKIANKSVTGDKLSDTAITDKFETKLLGTTISEKEPKEFINESVFSKTISQDLYFSGQQVWKTPSFELTIKITENERIFIDVSMGAANMGNYRARYRNTFSLNNQKLFPNIQQIFNILLSKSIEYGADGTITSTKAIEETGTILGLAIEYTDYAELTELAGEPINFSKSITNILPQEYLLEWDYNHLGIWVEI